jgi:4-amino-4-deoxy-L-arabinose transferase-like glycosyltransferase
MIFRKSFTHAWRSSFVAGLSLFLIALGIRLLYLRGAPVWPVSFGDGGSYLLEASHLLQGDWRKFFTSTIAATEGPVYPLLVSLVLLLSGRRAEAIEAIPRDPNLLDPSLVMPIQIVQAVLGALTCVAIAAAGRRTGSRLGRGAGLVGGSFFAILPTHILYTSYTDTEVAATAIAAAGVLLAIGPPQVWRELGVGLMLGIATIARITLAYAAVLVPASTVFVRDRSNLNRRIASAACGVLVVFAIVLACRSLIIVAGGAPYVGPGAISDRIDAMVNAADPSHFGWGDDRVPYLSGPGAGPRATKQWTLERDREEFLDREGIQRWRVPPEVTKVIQGNHVQVNVTAHSLRSGVLPELRYIAPYQSSSPGHQIRPGKTLEVSVPLTVLGNHHFVELRDTDRAVDITKVELVFPRFPANVSEFLTAIPRIITNGFMNFWYAETFGNIVGGSEQFPDALIQGLQHALLALAAIGAARACVEFGSWAPVLAFWAGGLMVGIKWIEQRHNMPFMPAVCLLAGLGATWLGTSFFVRRSYFYSLPFLIGTVLLVLGAMCAALDALSVPFIAWTPLSDFSLPLALTGASVLLWNECSALNPVRRLAALTPIFLFLLAYTCYVSTEPTARWKHHYANIPRDGTRLAQHFRLPDLESGRIVKAAVLLDLESMDRTASLVVRLNGIVIGETRENARSLFPTDPNGPSDPAYVRLWWDIYATAYQRPLDTWPQWWEIPFDPRLLTGSNVQIEISMSQNGPALRIGSTRGEEPGSFLGPSISRTSISRWRTTGDWRFWESFPNAGTIESTMLNGNNSRPYGATLGIRLLTEDRSGNVALY